MGFMPSPAPQATRVMVHTSRSMRTRRPRSQQIVGNLYDGFLVGYQDRQVD